MNFLKINGFENIHFRLYPQVGHVPANENMDEMFFFFEHSYLPEPKIYTSTKIPYDFTPQPMGPVEIKKQVSQKDGMTLVYIPEGEFLFGRPMQDHGGPSDELRPLFLDAFWIDQTEVTNGMFERCVKDGGCTPPIDLSSATRASYYGNPEYADFPVVFITWNQAEAYCAWAGRRLPTEFEWEKAARGTDARPYPWGNEPYAIDKYANISTEDTTKVGSYPLGTSPYGVMDMTGNVWEAVSNWLDISYQARMPYENPPGADTGTEKVVKGCSYGCPQQNWPLQWGSNWDLTGAGPNVGFRCATSNP